MASVNRTIVRDSMKETRMDQNEPEFRTEVAEREARERAQCERIEAIQRRIVAFGSVAVQSAGRSSEQIEELLFKLEPDAPGDEFAEFISAACQAHEAALTVLETMLLRARHQARIQREQAELVQSRRLATLRLGAQGLVDAAGQVLAAFDAHEIVVPSPVARALDGLRTAVLAIEGADQEIDRDSGKAAA